MRNLFLRYLLFGLVLASCMVGAVLVDMGAAAGVSHCALALGG
ncbi:hypothetical protein [Paludibacterium sp. B53371]|nr:hypothetical protein [Paludibacterium sp. B53371]